MKLDGIGPRRRPQISRQTFTARLKRAGAPEASAQHGPKQLAAPPTPSRTRTETSSKAGHPGHITSFSQLSSRRKNLTMIGVVLAMLLSALDQTIVGTALPRVVRDLGGLDHISWVVTAYLLASTVTVPIYGKLSDMFGRKWFFFSGIVIFLVASVLCGFSGSMLQLIIFRALQGIGGGAIMGNAFAIIGDLFPPAERGKWQGVLGGVFGLASVIGPALGGFLTDQATWRWVFFINIPLGLVALGVISFLMPRVKPAVTDKRIDFWGAGLLITTLVPLLLGLVWGGNEYAWGSTTELALFAGGAISLLAFLWAEHKAPQPVLPLDLFRNRTFVVSVSAIFLTGMAMFGAILYIPIFGQLVLGVSATNSGAILTPLMLGLVAASIVSGQLVSRLGKYRYLVISGLVILTGGLAWLSQITPDTSQFSLILRMICVGVGLGTTMPIFNIAVQNAFDNSRIGVVTAATQLFRSVGGTVGTAILGSMFNHQLTAKAASLADSDFAHTATKLHLPLGPINAQVVQGLLSPGAQSQVVAGLMKLPPKLSATTISSFHDFIAASKGAFSSSVGQVFLVAAIISGLSLLISLAMPEVPLRRSAKPPSHTQEAGDELAVEFGQAEAKDEPQLAR